MGIASKLHGRLIFTDNDPAIIDSIVGYIMKHIPE